MKAEYRLEDKLEYYSYIFCYMDNILCMHHDPDDILNKLNEYVPFKPGSVGSTEMYCSTKLKCMQLHNGIWTWSMSPPKYVQKAARICKEKVTKHLSKVFILWKRADNPFESGYCPELDVSPVLGPDDASYHQF